MRIGVIGLGSIGRRHVGNLLALGCDVYGYDPNLAARSYAAELHPKARIFGLLGGDEHYDAWVIATPYDNHLFWVEQAVARRIPFFVEKPLGSLEQLPRWRELAAMDLPINQVGYQCRFHPKAQALKLLFPEPEHGSFFCAVDMRTWPGTYGPFLLEASHEIDMALWLGASAEVSNQWGVEHRYHFILGGSWGVTMRDRQPYGRLWSVGTWSDEGAKAEFDSPEALGDDLYRLEMVHFLDCVQKQIPTSVPLADGLRVLEVCAQVEALCPSSA